MNTLRPKLAAILVTGILGLSAAAAAPKHDGFSPPKKAPQSPATGAVMNFEEIEFLELPMNEVIDYLREIMEPTGVNFIVSDDVKDVQVRLQLRNVTFDQLTKAIEIASEGRVAIDPVDDSLFHVRAGDVKVARAEPVLQVFNLSKFLQGRTDDDAARAVEDLHKTVDIAFEMLSEAQQATGGSAAKKARLPINSKFHPGTKLMIVIGSREDVQVFHEVTSQLLGEPRPSARRAGNSYGGGMGMLGGGGEMGGAGAGMFEEDISDGVRGGLGGTSRPKSSGYSGGGGGGAPAKNPFAGSNKRR
jgi:hypothetical protein